MSRRIRQIGVLVVASLLALFALLPAVGAAPRAATQNVVVKDFEFAPKEITVNVGDTVTWKNEGPNRPHTVTASDKSFDSGNLNVGQEFSFTFNTAGTFDYVCQYHDVMQAKVIVQGAAAAPAQQATGSVDASDQAIANGEINVAKVTAGQDGWIVAHLDEGGAPGKVLGQTAVKAGDNADVKIKLSQDVPVGGKLWPMLHVDAGTIGTYEFPGADVPVPGADGKPVMKQITVTAAAGGAAPAAATPAVTVADQALQNQSITVANVTAAQDGWIVAHLDEGGAPGKVLGQTAVKAGDNANVAIQLSENVPAGGKLWPMLHVDAGAVGTYEFPGADVPVKDAAGNIVMKQISVTAAGGQPAALPRTGGEDGPVVLVLAAMALLVAGAALMLRRRTA
jgi:LPXTG-motif cell wall-anchored protein